MAKGKVMLGNEASRQWIEYIPTLLVNETLTVSQIADKTGLSYNWTLRYVWKLKEMRLIHIHGWKRAEGKMPRYVANYGAGPRYDAPKPKPMTSTEVSRRRRKDPDYREKENARKRAKKWCENATKKRDPLMTALFGPPANSKHLKEAA